MALKDTCKSMRSLLESVQGDLEKAEAGNKAAAQRVRTTTIKLEKIAKLYRKESVKADRNGIMAKAKATAKKKGSTPKKTSKTVAAPSSQKTMPSAKKNKIPTARKKPTAKLPKSGRRKK